MPRNTANENLTPAEAEKREGFSDEGQRVSVTLEGLKKEFGPKAGEAKYIEVASVRNKKDQIAFFDPRAETTDYRPSLDLSGLDAETRAKVDAILVKE